MSPAGATDPRGLQASGVPGGGGPTDQVRRLESALERIAAGLVRQAERDADRRDRMAASEPVREAGATAATSHVAELRERLDRVIAVLRTAIEEAEG